MSRIDEIKQLKAERDEAQAQQRHAWERHAEKDRAYQQALDERDKAQKDREQIVAELIAKQERTDAELAEAKRLLEAEGKEVYRMAWELQHRDEAAFEHHGKAQAEIAKLKAERDQAAGEVALLRQIFEDGIRGTARAGDVDEGPVAVRVIGEASVQAVLEKSTALELLARLQLRGRNEGVKEALEAADELCQLHAKAWGGDAKVAAQLIADGLAKILAAKS